MHFLTQCILFTESGIDHTPSSNKPAEDNDCKNLMVLKSETNGIDRVSCGNHDQRHHVVNKCQWTMFQLAGHDTF